VNAAVSLLRGSGGSAGGVWRALPNSVPVRVFGALSAKGKSYLQPTSLVVVLLPRGRDELDQRRGIYPARLPGAKPAHHARLDGSRPRLQVRSARVLPTLSWHKITFYRREIA
jgi:hypothetical protein